MKGKKKARRGARKPRGSWEFLRPEFYYLKSDSFLMVAGFLLGRAN